MTHRDGFIDICLGRRVCSAVCGRPRHRVLRRATVPVRAALLLVLALVSAALFMPAAHAVVLRLRGGTVDRAITVGRAVDTVLMDGVSITNGVSVVFDVAAMLPGALRIDVRDCVCDGGSQLYVRGHVGEPARDRSLEVSVSGLSGRYCSLVFLHNLPAHTNVTVCNSTIVTPGPMHYAQLGGLTEAVTSPLVLYATSLSQTQMRVSNSVLGSLHAGGCAMYVGGGVDLLSSAVVLDGVSLEASGGPSACAMCVASSLRLSLRDHSVFSVTNASVVSSGDGIVLGRHLELLDSVLRFVGVEGSVASSMVRCDGGTIGAGGWLDMHDVWAVDEASSVASLSGVTLGGGAVSIARCAAAGATLVSGPAITSGTVAVQCNRAGGRVLRTSGDYLSVGLPSVSVVPCDGCAAALACFGALTASFSDCACICRDGGVGEACLPFDVPLAKAGSGGAEGCVTGVTLTESVTVGGGRATACFDTVVFSGPVTVAVDLRSMDAFADALNVTLRHCVLAGGVQLRIGGLSENRARLMPHALVNMTNVTSVEGTVVLHGAMPPNSSVLLANSTLRATAGGSLYVPTTRGHEGAWYGPAVVLDGVRLQSTQFVMTRSTLACGGALCAAILVERGLVVNLSSAFYMDNCAVRSRTHVLYALASDLRVGGGSVFSIQNSSWSAPSIEYYGGAWVFRDVVVAGGSVLQIVSGRFRLGFAMLVAITLTVTDGSWLVYRDNDFRTAYVVYVANADGGVAFRDGSVWSILDNNFTHGTYSLTIACMTNKWSPPSDSRPTIYGMCNELAGSPVTDYEDNLFIRMPVTSLDCGACTLDAVCFAARASSISGCQCVCAAGGHGDMCLPAAVPDGLGPLPDVNDTEIRCVHGGSIDFVNDPDPGVRGLCFVNVTFTAAIVLDLSRFDAPQQTLNITLLQCVFVGLSIRGSGMRVHLNVTSSMLDSGVFGFEGDFGASSHMLVAGSKLVSTSLLTVAFSNFSFGAHTRLLLLDNRIEGSNYAVHFSITVVVDGGCIIMKGNTLRAIEDEDSEGSAVYVYAVDVRNGGYFDVENNTMRASVGVFFYKGATVGSAGPLRVADCIFFGATEDLNSSLVYFDGSLTLHGDAQWRVEGNNVSAASVLILEEPSYIIELSGGGTTAVLAHNRQVDSSYAFAALVPSNIVVTPPARFIVGCNLQGDEEVSYSGVFPVDMVVFGCGTCNDDATCYMPGTESVDRGACSCRCKDGWHGASCLPVEVPDVAVPPVAERVVDDDTSCVVNQTLTSVTLNMWKTHHCYAGVTFSGVGAVLMFDFCRMPLHLPINITFTGCTFLGGAALLFVGAADDASASAGVLIRVSRTVMQSSVVAFLLTLPQHCDIAVTEVDAVQSREVQLLDAVISKWSVVLLDDVVLSASSLLVSNVKARASEYNAYGLYSIETLTLMGGSTLYVRYCSFDEYTHMLYVGAIMADDHSVFALLNNTMTSGTSLLYQYQDFSVSDHSVLRMVGNSGFVACAILAANAWTVQQSSWLDWRDNDVGIGAMFNYMSSNASVTVDGSSVVTLTGCRMGVTGLSRPLLTLSDAGYKFVAGCLTVAGRLVTTASELELNGITNVTTVVACGECTRDGHCFAPLTTAVSDCSCVCAAGGHGDVCVPAPLPLGPPPPQSLPPHLPPPPSVGECISDMVYPEVAQAVGYGLSWLCYRNVTFSGGGMSLTVLVGAMAGDVANVTFDGCTWQDGAVLLLAGNAHAPVGSLNIAVTGNTFHNALISPEGVFPPRTNITISGNRFTVTRLIPRLVRGIGRPSCVAMNLLIVDNGSVVVLSGNTFQAVTASSSAIYVVRFGLSVSWHSLFAVVGNTFHMDGVNNTLLHFGGGFSALSLEVLNSSAVVIRGNIVSRSVQFFTLFYSALRVESRSAVVVHGNDIQGSLVVFYSRSSSYIYYGSWLQVSGNLCRVSPVGAFAVLRPRVNLRDSTVSVYGNQFMSSTVALTALWIVSVSHDLTNGVIVAACNSVSGGEEALYGIPSAYNASILTCSDSCALAASCFPAYTTTVSGDDCACTCAEGGHGDACLPVAVPEAPSTDGADLCVRELRVDEEVNAGAGTSVVCYVGVTFAADVVVDVGSMSGSVCNVTLANCTFVEGASLYVVGWVSDPPAGQRADVLISGLVSRSGGGVVVANRYPLGSRVTVVDSVLIAGARVAYRSAYDLDAASACLVVHKVNLTGSVLTIARTQVVALFGDAVGVLVVGGVALSSRGALYVDGLLVQTALGLCVSLEGGVAASGGSVVAFVDSDFLLCKHAVSVRGAVSVSGSAVLLMRSHFASAEDHAVAFYSTVSLAGGSLLLVKGNVHDGVSRELLYAAGAVTAVGSTLSFVRNRAVLPQMLSVSLSLGAGARLRVACNDAGGRVLSTADEYAAAGFGDAGSIDVVGCDACDRDTHCYAPGTASASMRDGACVCVCGSGGYGEACVPVGAPALPPAGDIATGVFVLDNVTVRSAFVVPFGASEVTLRDVVLEGVSPVLYVPWMARAGVRIVVQNVSLLNGAVLYVMGGAGLRGAGATGSDDGGPVELSVCDLEALNGALVLMGAFPAGSVLTVTDSLLVSTRPTPRVYFPGSRSAPYAPVLVLSGLRLVRSVLVVSSVALVTVMTGGRAVVVDGAALELVGSGVALDGLVFGGDFALYASARVAASDGAVLRVSGSQVHAAHGLVFDNGVVANASAVVVNDNTGALTDGALLILRGSASFVSGSWLSVRGNSVSGRLLSVPSYPRSAEVVQSTLTLHGNTGTGPVVMDGTVALGGAGRKFVVGCLTLNGRALLPLDYRSAGIVGEFRPVACGVCDADVSCFAGATRAVSGSCRCRCAEGGYGRDCLPVHLPHVDGCNLTPARPLLSHTATLTEPRSSTLTPTPSLSATRHSLTPYWPTGTVQVTETAALPRTLTPTASVSSTMWWSDVACPTLAVTTTAAGGCLAQNDIRGEGSVVPARLMVALPPPFRWASDPRLGAYLSFEPVSAAQPSGFGGPWGAMLSNATWVRNATNPTSVLELAVPVYGGYYIDTDETIAIRCDAVAVSGGCRGVLLGSFTIRSSTPPAAANALSALTGVVAGAAAVGVVVTGGLGSMLEMQALGVLAKMSCASAQERASTAALPYFLSVFAALDPLWMVVGNALLAAAFGCVHYGVAAAFQRWRGVDAASAWAAVRFPSVTYTVAHAMHLGIVFGSVLALEMPGARVQHYVVGVVGVLYGVAFPAGVCYLIARHTGASFTKYWQFSGKPLRERLLYPVGYWHPAAQRRMYGGMLTNMKGNYVCWCVFQLSALCVVCVIAAVPPPAGSCHVPYFCMTAFLLAGACVVAFTDMMRSAFLTVVHTAGFVLLAALCLVSAANRLTPSDGGARAYAATVLLLTILVLATTVYGAVVWYVEDRHWQELREPQCQGLEALLNDDDMSDEDAQEPGNKTSLAHTLGTTGASSYHAPAGRQPVAGGTYLVAMTPLDSTTIVSGKGDGALL